MKYVESPEFEFQLPKLKQKFLSADELICEGVVLPFKQKFLSADELICEGVVLPFNLLSSKPEPDPEAEPEPAICSTAESMSSSKRWTNYILKLTDKKKEATPAKGKKERGSRNKAELNINIWPFSRSHSAGTAAASSPKPLPLMRKSMSEPCSRSSSGRRCAPGGVHMGRASPVWQGKQVIGSKRAGKDKVKRPGLNFNVNSCIRGDSIQSDSSFIRFRSLFTAKKVH